MKKYRKPVCISSDKVLGIVPLAGIASAVATAAASTVATSAVLSSVGGAALAGAAAGLALNSQGGHDFSSLQMKGLKSTILQN